MNKINTQDNQRVPCVISWNIQGLRTGRSELKILSAEKDPLTICLQETMCVKQQHTNIAGYKIYHRQRTSGQRAAGGVITAVKLGIDSEEINLNTDLEAVAVKISHPLQTTILNVYLPPGRPVSTNDIYELLAQIPHPFLLVGDINAHHPLWGSNHVSPRGKILEECINETGLFVLNSGDSTYVSHASGIESCIDIACCSSDLAGQLDFSTAEDTRGSDHIPVIITFPGAIQQQRPNPKWKMDEADWTLFQSTVQFENKESPEDQILEITNKIIGAAQASIPRSKGLFHKNTVPWWNPSTAEAIQSRKKALRKLQYARSHNQDVERPLHEFQKARRRAREIIDKAKTTSWREYVSQFTVQTPIKDMWKNFRRIQGKARFTRINAISLEGNTTTSNEEIAENLAEAFRRVSSDRAYNHEFIAHKQSVESMPLIIPDEPNAEYNKLFSNNELEEVLEGLRGSSPGVDTIHYSMIMHLPAECKRLLLEAYNRLWTSGIYPQIWTESIVIPIYKGKGKREDPGNYRPIYLNSCLGKVFERMVNNRLTHILEERKLLFEHQYAFRKGKSTVDHLTELETIIREASRKNEYTQAIFLDIKKAYDTTWRRLILERLSNWGIGGMMLNFIQQLLSERSFKVIANGELSNRKIMDNGLCQGSVLSVTLFLIAIDTLTEQLPENVRALFYADDVVLVASGKKLTEIEKNLQNALQKILEWEKQTGFEISAEKSCTVIFRNPRSRKPDKNSKLTWKGETISCRSNYKCLGVILDQCLKFSEHVEELKASCQQRIHFIRCVAAKSWGGDRNTLLKLYRATVLEKLLYAAPILSDLDDTTVKKLETVHNAGLRAISGAFHTSPIVSIQSETGIPSLQILIQQRTAIFAARKKALESNQEPEYSTSDSSDISSDDESNSSGELWNTASVPEPNTAKTRGKTQIAKLELELPTLTLFVRPESAPWERVPISVDKSLLIAVRNGASSIEIQNKFSGKKRTKYRIYRTIYTDGSKRSNRCGYSVVSDGMLNRRRINGSASIFTAENNAIIHALEWILSLNCTGAYLICTDSLSVITSLEKQNITTKWRDKAGILYENATRNGSSITFFWVPSHMGILGNELADIEAKRALDDPEPDNDVLEFNEFKTVIKKRTLWAWQAIWHQTTSNHLRRIKNTVLPYTAAFTGHRKQDVILTRLRIGHTQLTHSYLLEKKPPPNCRWCNASTLTIKHIIEECSQLDNERQAVGLRANIREALADNKTRAKQVLTFLENIAITDCI